MARSNQTPAQAAVAPKKPGQRRKIGSAHADPAIANCAPRQLNKQHSVANRDAESPAVQAPQTVHSIDASCRRAIDQLERALATADGAKGIALAIVDANQSHLFLNCRFESAEWKVCNANGIQQIHQKLCRVASRGDGLDEPAKDTSCSGNVRTTRRNDQRTSITIHPTSEHPPPSLPIPSSTNSTQPRKRSLTTTSFLSYSESESDSEYDEPPGETIIDKSFRTDDRAAVKEYLQFRLLEFPGVLLKDVVSNWVKKVPEWRGFQKGGELQSAPRSWPEGIPFKGVHRLKKREVVRLGAHVLTRFYYDEDAYDGWPTKLETKIDSYLKDENAKFSSSSNLQTREENRHLVREQVFPELWENLKIVESYEAMCRECQSNGDPPPKGDTITYHPFRIRNKKKKPMSVRQKRPTKQQRPRRHTGNGKKKSVAGDESLAAKLEEMVPPADGSVDEHEYPPTEPESPDIEMHDELRASSPSLSVARDDPVQTEHGIAQEDEPQNYDLNGLDAYSSSAQRSFKASFTSGPDMQDIPQIDTNANEWTAVTQFGFQGQFHQPEMEHGQLQSFYSDATEYSHVFPPATTSFSTVGFPEPATDRQSFSQIESVPMGGFHSFDVHDQSQLPKHDPDQSNEPLDSFPTFTNITPTGFAQYAVSNCFAEPGYYGTASTTTVLPTAIPTQISFVHPFQETFSQPTQREYETQHSHYGENMTMGQTPFHQH